MQRYTHVFYNTMENDEVSLFYKLCTWELITTGFFVLRRPVLCVKNVVLQHELKQQNASFIYDK